MTKRKLILFFISFPILIGIFFIISFINTCQRFPDLELDVRTESVTFLSGRDYILIGSIESFGHEPVTEHGFCWAETNDPTADGNSTRLGAIDTKGIFTSTISDLSSSTEYFIRAYVVTSSRTVYGEEKSITTPSASRAVVSTRVATNVDQDTVLCGGDISDDGGASIIARGVCWDVSIDPSIDGSHTTDGSGTGNFSSRITGLTCSAKYYIRAYATNAAGTAYGISESFTYQKCDSVLFQVETNEIINITQTTAQSGGNVSVDGGPDILARGVCWNTSPSPSITDFKTTESGTSGSFVSELTDLDCGTIYYVRAYATNSVETAYGPEEMFTAATCNTKPVVASTTVPYNITTTSAQSGGNITDDGGAQLIEKGVCWNTSPNPTISDFHTAEGNEIGSFTSVISGLECETTYYVRAYATNSEGTSYGDQKEFITDYCTTVTDYDGNTYQIVRIGDQAWIQENLKVLHYSDGTKIQLVEGTSEWEALSETGKAYCFFENNPANKDEYGVLYSWAAAMNGVGSSVTNPSGVQGVCPVGWHIPSDAEWKELEIYLGMSQAEADDTQFRGTDEGGKLKEIGSTHWNSPNIGATNTTGFTALPGGHRRNDGSFDYLGNDAYFWSATESNSLLPWNRILVSYDGKVIRGEVEKDYGYSVRCLQD